MVRITPSPRPMLAHERIYVGIDVGKATHCAGLISTTLLARHARFEQCPHLVFAQSRAGFAELTTYLASYTPLAQCIVLLENTGHYHKAIEQYLLDAGCTVYITHVQKRPSRMMKSDKRDALSLGNLLFNQVEKEVQVADSRQQARKVAPHSETARKLHSLVRHRYELVAEATQRKNKLTSVCDELFPELTTVFKNPNGTVALALRDAYPTPEALAKASVFEVMALRQGHRPARAALIGLMRDAANSIGTHDPYRVAGLVIEQRQLIAELRLVQKHLDELNTKIMAIVEESREGQILTSIPVIGAMSAAALIATIGTIGNFERASQLKAYLGWAPVTTQTGTTSDSTTLTRSGNRSSRQLLYMATLAAIRSDTEWKLLYDRLVPKKCTWDARTKSYKGKLKVVGRICGQMIEMIFMLLKTDAAVLENTPPGDQPPPPALYNRAVHKRHRAGFYRPAKAADGHTRALITPLHPPE